MAGIPPVPSKIVDPPEVHARIRDAIDLVEGLASQLWHQVNRAVPREELTSFASEGLLSAARAFDATRNVPFRCWATIRIRGAMLDGLRTMGGLPRRLYRDLRAMRARDLFEEACLDDDASSPPEAPEAADARLATYLAGMATAMAVGFLGTSDPDDAPSPEEQVLAAEVLRGVREAVARLPEQERSLIEGHYFGDLTLDEAARALGLSKSWGSRLHARAIEGITRDLRRARIAR